MKLHTYPEEFRELITVVANDKHISESAVECDYYIVMMLKALADSPYAEQCVFKGSDSYIQKNKHVINEHWRVIACRHNRRENGNLKI